MQREHSSADIVKVVSWICDNCELLPAPSEGGKINGFHAGLDPEDQPYFYCLLIGNASTDILADVDDCVSSSFSGM